MFKFAIPLELTMYFLSLLIKDNTDSITTSYENNIKRYNHNKSIIYIEKNYLAKCSKSFTKQEKSTSHYTIKSNHFILK